LFNAEVLEARQDIIRKRPNQRRAFNWWRNDARQLKRNTRNPRNSPSDTRIGTTSVTSEEIDRGDCDWGQTIADSLEYVNDSFYYAFVTDAFIQCLRLACAEIHDTKWLRFFTHYSRREYIVHEISAITKSWPNDTEQPDINYTPILLPVWARNRKQLGTPNLVYSSKTTLAQILCKRAPKLTK